MKKSKIKKTAFRNFLLFSAFTIFGNSILIKEHIKKYPNISNETIKYIKTKEEFKDFIFIGTKDIYDVYDALDNNNNIDKEMKSEIKIQLQEISKTNKLDYEFLYLNIKKLKKVEKISKEEMAKIFSDDVLGVFFAYKHELYIIDRKDYRLTLRHELMHLNRILVYEFPLLGSFVCRFGDENNLGTAIDEAYTSKSSYTYSYFEEQIYLREIEKWLGKEKVSDIIQNKSIDDLINELCNIIPNKKKWENWFYAIDQNCKSSQSNEELNYFIEEVIYEANLFYFKKELRNDINNFDVNYNKFMQVWSNYSENLSFLYPVTNSTEETARERKKAIDQFNKKIYQFQIESLSYYYEKKLKKQNLELVAVTDYELSNFETITSDLITNQIFYPIDDTFIVIKGKDNYKLVFSQNEYSLYNDPNVEKVIPIKDYIDNNKTLKYKSGNNNLNFILEDQLKNYIESLYYSKNEKVYKLYN